MPIEFVCSGCQSKHACADHMVGRQFKCGGCGRLLEVPAAGDERHVARASAAHRQGMDDEPADAGEQDGMGVGLQMILLIVGGILLVVMFFGCIGAGLVYLLAVPGPPQAPDAERVAPVPAIERGVDQAAPALVPEPAPPAKK